MLSVVEFLFRLKNRYTFTSCVEIKALAAMAELKIIQSFFCHFIGDKRRDLWSETPAHFTLPRSFDQFKMVLPGIIAVKAPAYKNEKIAESEMTILNEHLKAKDLNSLLLFVLCDDADFCAASINNFVWVTFTRSNPSTDIYGVNSFTENKHWGCKGPLIIDARKKPHHAPELIKDPSVEKRVDALAAVGKPLHGII